MPQFDDLYESPMFSVFIVPWPHVFNYVSYSARQQKHSKSIAWVQTSPVPLPLTVDMPHLHSSSLNKWTCCAQRRLVHCTPSIYLLQKHLSLKTWYLPWVKSHSRPPDEYIYKTIAKMLGQFIKAITSRFIYKCSEG